MEEQNKCIRCGKPCSPGETMCDECRSWFQSQVKPGGTSAKPVKKTEKKTTEQKKENGQTNSKKWLFIVLGIVLICVVVMAGVLLTKKKRDEKAVQQAAGKEQEVEQNSQNAVQEPEEKEMLQQEPIWEDADVDGIANHLVVFEGILTGQQLELKTPVSVYLYDVSGNKVFVQKVQYVKMIDQTGNEKLASYNAVDARVTGNIVYDEDGAVSLYIDQLEAEQPNMQVSEEGIHDYEFVLKDCSWNEAFYDSIQRGGHLVHINSREEQDYIFDQINKKGYDKVHFYLGGRREADGREYFWVDQNNVFCGETLNNSSAWCSGEWMTGEPSFEDLNLQIEESYMNIFYYKKEHRIVWSDGPDNIPQAVSAFKGKVGYIVEYEQ